MDKVGGSGLSEILIMTIAYLVVVWVVSDGPRDWHILVIGCTKVKGQENYFNT